MFVALIDTRPRFEPEPEPEPARRRLSDLEVPWRMVAVALVTLALTVAAMFTSGLPGLALILLAVIVPAAAIERSLGSWTGMKDHRQ